MPTVAQIGNGNMGSVISEIIAKNGYNLTVINKNSKIPDEKFDIVIIATKPQIFNDIKELTLNLCKNSSLVISIMAGISSFELKKAFPLQKVARIMPNIGLKTNCGVSLYFKKTKLPKKLENFIQSIFASNNNLLINLQSDDEINNLTPFTGSGSALFLKFASIFQEEFLKYSEIEERLLQRIIMQIIMQALDMSQNQSFDDAINKIASKGGVTQAMIEGFNVEITQAINAGQKKGRDLCQN